MSPTYLNLVNAVLRRLREDVVGVVDADTRGAIIGSFINVAKEEVENAWNWTVLKQDLTLTTTSGYAEDYLPDSNPRTRFIRTETSYEGYNNTSRWPMRRQTNGQMDRLRLLQAVPSGSPYWFSVIGKHDTAHTLKLRLYPKPDAAYDLVFPVIVPQDTLSDDTTLLKVPWRPVVEKAYLLAIMERGEDIGQASEAQTIVIRQAMADAIGSDTEKIDDENIWVPR